MGAHEVVLTALRISPEGQQTPAGGATSIHVLRRCHRFLQVFVRENAQNQAQLVDHIELVASHLPLDVGAEETILEVYRGNRRLCDTVKEGVIRACVNMVEQSGRDKKFLGPLHEFVRCRDIPIKRNQLLVLKVLLEAHHSTALYVCNDEESIAERDELLRVHEASGAAEFTGLLAYHVDILLLLTSAADGKMGVAGAGAVCLLGADADNEDAEAKCQSLIAYGDLVTQIESMKNPALKSTYVDFLHAVYVDAETPVSVGLRASVPVAVHTCANIRASNLQVDSSNDTWRLLFHFVDQLRGLVGEGTIVPPNWVDYVFESMVPTVTAIMTLAYHEESMTPPRSAKLVEGAMLLGRLFDGSPSSNSRAIGACMRALDRAVMSLGSVVPQYAVIVASDDGRPHVVGA